MLYALLRLVLHEAIKGFLPTTADSTAAAGPEPKALDHGRHWTLARSLKSSCHYRPGPVAEPAHS